jgi:hypothetical protein
LGQHETRISQLRIRGVVADEVTEQLCCRCVIAGIAKQVSREAEFILRVGKHTSRPRARKAEQEQQ